MIKGKELRLGNLVKDRGEKVIRIDFLEHIQDGYDTKFGQLIFLEGTEVHPMTEYSDYANAIPITEDWLIRFGFKKEKDEWKLFPCFEIQIIVFNEGNYNGIMFYLRTIHTDFVPIYLPSKMNCVHELQNFYNCLTGEELQYAR